MHHGSNMYCSFAAWGLAVAALLTCGATGQAQVVGGNGMSGGLGGSSLGGSSFATSNLGMSSFSGGGGLSGNSFAGGGGTSFSGGSFGGGSFSGAGGMGSYGSSFRGGNGLTGGVSQTNPFYSSYANPLQGGVGSNAAFGTPLYGNASTTTGGQGTAGSRGTSSTASGGGSSGPGSIYGALGIVSVARAEPPPVPTVGVTPSPVAGGIAARPTATVTALPASMQADFEDLVSRTDRISPETREAVKFGLNGGTVVLRGNAASQADAHALESLIRFAPGVREVRNEMTWRSP
jgi:hypothetical protein